MCHRTSSKTQTNTLQLVLYLPASLTVNVVKNLTSIAAAIFNAYFGVYHLRSAVTHKFARS